MDTAPNAALDNDVLIKLAAYDMLGEAPTQVGTIGVLGAARFVVRSALERHRDLQDRDAARARWEAALDTLQLLEPSESEVQLATHLEERATVAGLPLDGGESQLCAMVILRGIPLLVTGDKRAIEAAEAMIATVSQLAELAGRVLCLEQLMALLVDDLGANEARRRVCAEPGADRSLTICMSCSGLASGSHFDPGGLVGYVENLRASASMLLWKQPAS